MRLQGFTLIELLIVIAILGVLLALSLGWFTPNRLAVNQAAQVLAAQFNRVRFEALRNNTYAGLLVDPNANSNRGSYTLWIDRNGTSQYDTTPTPADEVLQTITFGPITSGQQNDFARVMRVNCTTPCTGTDLTTSFIFDSRGIARTGNARVVVISTLDNNFKRKVCINSQGRAEVVEETATCS